MAINTMIPLAALSGVQPVELPSERRDRQLRTVAAEQQVEVGAARLRDIARQEDDMRMKTQRAQAVRDAMMRAGDAEKALPEIWKIDPEAGAFVEKAIGERKKAALEEQGKKLEMESKRWDAAVKGSQRLSDMYAAVSSVAPEKRGDVYKVQRAAAIAAGWAKPEQLPDTMPSDAEMEAFAKQHLGAEKLQELRLKSEEAGRALAEHRAKLPGMTADPKTGLTPQQAAALEIQRGAQGETKRHNQATEALGKEGNAIRRENGARRASAEDKQTQAAWRSYEAQVKAGEADITDLEKDKVKVYGEIAKWEAILKQNPVGMMGGESATRKEAAAKLSGVQAQLATIESQQKAIKSRMNAAQAAKDALGGGDDSAGGGGAVERWEFVNGKLTRVQ